MQMPLELVQKFFSDLRAARPLSQLELETPCAKSISFGTSTYISYKGELSPDLSCSTDQRATVLVEDIKSMTKIMIGNEIFGSALDSKNSLVIFNRSNIGDE